jgi:hypothetical protein
MPLDLARVDRIMEAMETMMRCRFVTRSIETITRRGIEPEPIDDVVLAAINTSLCLISDGDDRFAEGFNDDIARNGRNFGQRCTAIDAA